MSRFSELIDQAADQKANTLSDVLMKAKVLASQLRSRKFRQWLDAELNGYEHPETIPDYRILSAQLLGEFGGYFHSFLRTPLSVTHLDQEIFESLTTHKECNGISFVEDLLCGSGSIGRYLDGAAVNYLRHHGPWVENMILNRVYKTTSHHEYRQLLQSVRSGLLDFLLELRGKHPELDKDDAAVARISETEIDSVLSRKLYQNCTVFEGATEMRDSYQAGQAGAMGPGAKAENINFIQILRDSIGEKSLADLAKELEQLRLSMLAESKNAKQDEAVAAVAEAEDAAKKGDAKGVLFCLKRAGKWAFDIATKIGTAVASKAIEKTMEGS